MSADGSTRKLIQLCFGYWFFYVITGVAVKYFTTDSKLGFPRMTKMQYLSYSTLGCMAITIIIIFVWRWYKLHTNKLITWGSFKFPYEFLYIIPSGVFTALIIPMTTLIYTLPISIMVAMVTMQQILREFRARH